METILVVDDNPLVLELVVKVLAGAGFEIISAASGLEAIALAHTRKGVIDMLLSDVEMPRMSGPALGEVLKVLRPDIHVMLMSGGAGDGNLLVLNCGWAFIEKPFVRAKLIEMVTSVLHEPNRSQLGGNEFDLRKDLKSSAPALPEVLS